MTRVGSILRPRASLLCALALAMVIGLTPTLGWTAPGDRCVPGPWVSPPNSLWDPVNGSFPVRVASEHFELRWTDAKANLTVEQGRRALEQLERVYAWYVSDAVGWPEPYCNLDTKYKFQIFADEGYGMSGAGAGQGEMAVGAMWVPAGAIRVAADGEIRGMVHEFTHSMQFNSGGMRDGEMPGWMWESHAEFMANHFPGALGGTGCTHTTAHQPHLAIGHTRLRYCNWQFWDFVSNQPGLGMRAVSNIWRSTAFVLNQDPVRALRDSNGLSQRQFGDLVGRYAMANVNWDYIEPDGFNRGVVYRRDYGTADSFINSSFAGTEAIFLRRARMEPIDLGLRRFKVSSYYAPETYGHNHVMLVPDRGATEITVDFRGVVQDRVAAGAQYGTLDLEPGKPNSPWAKYSVPENPASDWRWGVVTITNAGESRYTEMKSGATGRLTVPLRGDERSVILVVAATPSEHHGFFWEQKYHTRYRYPYKIQLTGAMPEGFEPGYNPAARYARFGPGKFHPNGGGWVADRAIVESSVYVGPNAAVLGGEVRGTARILDYAAVFSGIVRGNATIGGLTQVNRQLTFEDNVEVYLTLADGHAMESGRGTLGGNSKWYGDAMITGLADRPAVTRGAFTGVTWFDRSQDPNYGANLTAIPIEVTAPVDNSWDGPPPPPPSTTTTTAPSTSTTAPSTSTTVPSTSTTVPSTTTTAPGPPTTAPSTTAPSTTVPGPVDPGVIDLGGFEEGEQAAPGGFVLHPAGSSFGPWQVSFLVSRDQGAHHGGLGPNGHHLDLDREGGVGRLVSGLVPGARYRLEFDAARHRAMTGVVTGLVVIDGVAREFSPTTASNVSFEKVSVEFTASSSTVELVFSGLASPDPCCGAVIDNPRIVRVSTPPPPPDTPGAISGAVANGDGSPVAGVVVDLFTAAADGSRAAYLRSVPTGADGRFVFDDVDPGCYVLTFIAPDGRTFTNGSKWLQDGNCVQSGQAVVGVDAELVGGGAGGASITGAVVSENGTPAAGAVVDLFTALADGSRGVYVRDTRTGADGSYRFDVKAGCQVVTFIAPEGRLFTSGSRWSNRTVCPEPGQIVGGIDATLAIPQG